MKLRRVKIMVEGESDMPIKEIKDIFNFNFTDQEISGKEVTFKTWGVKVDIIEPFTINMLKERINKKGVSK